MSEPRRTATPRHWPECSRVLGLREARMVFCQDSLGENSNKVESKPRCIYGTHEHLDPQSLGQLSIIHLSIEDPLRASGVELSVSRRKQTFVKLQRILLVAPFVSGGKYLLQGQSAHPHAFI